MLIAQCDARYGKDAPVRHTLPRMDASQVHHPLWSIFGRQNFCRAAEVCQIGMLFVSASSLWGFSSTIGLPYELALQSAVLRMDFALLIVLLFAVFASRSFPAAPVVAWIAFEITWLISNMHWRGGQAGVPYALATWRMQSIYGALAIANWYFLVRSQKQGPNRAAHLVLR